MRAFVLSLAVIVAAGCAREDPTPSTTVPVLDSDVTRVEDEGPEEGGFTVDYAAMTVEGTWRSTEDTSVVVTFSPGQFEERYDGEAMLLGPVTFTETCDGSDGGGDLDTFSFTISADDDPICYDVVEGTGGTLEYTMHGGRGNTLAFERVD